MTDDPQTPKWQSLESLAILTKHKGDVVGAIEYLKEAIDMIGRDVSLTTQRATMFNYLADLYLTAGFLAQAERAIREAVTLSSKSWPIFYADNLLILAEVHAKKGEHTLARQAADEALLHYRKWYEDYPERIVQVEEQVEGIKSYCDKRTDDE